MSNEYKERRYPDSIETSEGHWVRVSSLPAEKVIRIGKKRIPIKVGDIPMTAVALTCGTIVRGIAFNVGDVVFCEVHQQNEFVATILGQ